MPSLIGSAFLWKTRGGHDGDVRPLHDGVGLPAWLMLTEYASAPLPPAFRGSGVHYPWPPVKWHGGKRYLAQRIIALFPPHRLYLEPFGGAALVLLNKPPCEVEIYNDLDQRISRLSRVLREQGDAFLAKASLIPYSQAEFTTAARYPAAASDLDKALCDFLRWRQSFGGQGKSWSYARRRSRGGMAETVHAWWTAIDQLPAIVDRLQRVQLLCQPALEAIERFDDADALIYCDPPYVHSTREANSRQVYRVEMTNDDHRDLARTLRGCKGHVVRSGNPSALYDELYGDWRRVSFDVANHAAKGYLKPRRTECVWMNF